MRTKLAIILGFSLLLAAGGCAEDEEYGLQEEGVLQEEGAYQEEGMGEEEGLAEEGPVEEGYGYEPETEDQGLGAETEPGMGAQTEPGMGAQAESFAEVDANGNGLISEEEAQDYEALAGNFDQADANADGYINRNEFEQVLGEQTMPQ